MHGFAVVSESFLREPLRVAARLGPLRPRIPIRVKGDAFDAQPLTTLLELRGAVAGANGCEIRKQRAGYVQATQNRLNIRSEVHHGEASGLLAGVGDGLVGPINVFRLEIRNVGLRATEMPAQFIEAAALRV